jgi:hypothetical protein
MRCPVIYLGRAWKIVAAKEVTAITPVTKAPTTGLVARVALASPAVVPHCAQKRVRAGINSPQFEHCRSRSDHTPIAELDGDGS